MTGARPVSLGRRMFLEEYRMHTRLFGRRRFVGFPLFLLSVVGVGVWLLARTDTSLSLVVGGLFVLVLFVGLQVGTVGLVGRDAMRDVLGETTLLVFSARTLPVTRRRLLTVFLAKDLLYYILLFLTPMAVGFLPLVIEGGFTLGQVGLLWLTLAGTFALGVGGSLALAGLASRSRLAVVVLVVAVGAAVALDPGLALALSPYALYAEPGPGTALSGAVGLAVALVTGPLLFEPPTRVGTRRVEHSRYRALRRAGGPLAARSLLEVRRSSGSVWKVAFSLGVLGAVAALLFDRIVVAMGIEPSAGIGFATLLGLGTFTTYNWVTQHDGDREYLRYPVTMRAVFAGKLRAFLALSLPTGLVYLALAGLLFPRPELLLGVVVFPLLSVYVFGLTAYLTGLSPTELLFDTALFALYGAGLVAVGVPLLVAALAFEGSPLVAAAVAVALAAVAAGGGLLLARRAGPRWQDRLRAGS